MAPWKCVHCLSRPGEKTTILQSALDRRCVKVMFLASFLNAGGSASILEILCTRTIAQRGRAMVDTESLASDATAVNVSDRPVEVAQQEEFRRLGTTVYADYAGAGLYSERQLADVFQDLSTSVVGNPHSLHGLGGEASDKTSAARQLILEMCNAPPEVYDCIFTSGATGAMQMVADCFPWTEASSFMYSRDNHTSVVGMREIASRAGAATMCVHNLSQGNPSIRSDQAEEPIAHSLFAYPLESNFNGARYPEVLSSTVQACTCSGSPFSPSNSEIVHETPFSASHRSSTASTPALDPHQLRLGQQNAEQHSEHERHAWWVLLDAAKACATSPPDLSVHQPAFVVMSCYKIFGYPTGLGALLMRKDATAILLRNYFGGGTVEACSAVSDFVRRREGPAGLEHGTSSYLGIAALTHGFALIRRMGGFSSIHKRASLLARSLRHELQQLRHENGRPVCILYTGAAGALVAEDDASQDSTVVTLNLLRQDGSYIGYREAEKLATLNDIRLRGGCFCNPGACAAHLGLDDRSIKENFQAGHVCWDNNDLIEGRPTGAIRFSFGLASTAEDVSRILSFIDSNFVQHAPCIPASPNVAPGVTPRLEGIWVYPIKSCKGIRQHTWWLGQNGLMYDREWALVDSQGSVMTLKKYPQLAQIACALDLSKGLLTVTAPSMPSPLLVRLPSKSKSNGLPKPGVAGREHVVRICADCCHGMQVADIQAADDAVDPSVWMSKAVGVQCTLVQQKPGSRKAMQHRSKTPRPVAIDSLASLGFANEGQLLLINQASLEDLATRLQEGNSEVDQVGSEAFRPNLLVAGAPAFAEDRWARIGLGAADFEQSGGQFQQRQGKAVCAQASQHQAESDFLGQ